MSDPDAVLIFPPPMDRIARIYPAPHFLSTFLNNNGFHAKPLDLNLIALCRLANSSLLDKEIEFFDFKRNELEKKEHLSREEMKQYLSYLRSLGRLIFAKRNISNLREYQDLMELEINGIRYTRVFFELYQKAFSFFYRTKMPPLGELKDLVTCPASVSLDNLLQDEIADEIIKKDVPVVGFSIPFYQQLIPALALATEIKRNMKDVHICFGGPVITLLPIKYLKGMLDLLPIDSFVKYDGEVPLLKLLQAKKAAKPIDDIDNLLAAENNIMLRNIVRVQKPVSRSVYDHNRFEFSNIRDVPRSSAIPITQSAGCYWKKCSFCDYVNLHKDKKYCPRSVSDIIKDIRYYEKMGFSNFRMLAEAIPPKHAFEIASELIKNRLEITWHAFLRVDERFSVDVLKAMKASGFGCTVGMESANDRVLKTLGKGYDKNTIQNFFENIQKASLLNNHLNIMVGVPGARYEEDLETYEFCRNYVDIFSWFKSSLFTLSETSDMGKNPQKYGIRIRKGQKGAHPNGGGRLTPVMFEDPEGMSDDEKSAIIDLYDQLNKEIRLKLKYDGLYEKIVSAHTGKNLEDLTFIINNEELVRLKMKFFPRELNSSIKDKSKYMIINLREGRDHQFFMNSYFVKLMKSQSGNEFNFHDLCQKTGDESTALHFIQTMISGGLLDVVDGRDKLSEKMVV